MDSGFFSTGLQLNGNEWWNCFPLRNTFSITFALLRCRGRFHQKFSSAVGPCGFFSVCVCVFLGLFGGNRETICHVPAIIIDIRMPLHHQFWIYSRGLGLCAWWTGWMHANTILVEINFLPRKREKTWWFCGSTKTRATTTPTWMMMIMPMSQRTWWAIPIRPSGKLEANVFIDFWTFWKGKKFNIEISFYYTWKNLLWTLLGLMLHEPENINQN